MQSGEPSPVTEPRATRVLACILCQQRKIKCDRRFPCSNCVRASKRCVQAIAATRRRKRKFPERELLDRVRRYESLLVQNKVKFEPLRKDPDAAQNDIGQQEYLSDSDDEDPIVIDISTPSNERASTNDDFWQAITQARLDSDSDSMNEDADPIVTTRYSDSSPEKDDLLFGGSRSIAVDISSLHPGPGQIFKLWQIYLDNVDPLLKITHTPTLQRQIVDVVGNIFAVPPVLEAMMFAIYCISVCSLDENHCQTQFGYSRKVLLRRYHFGCQQALLNCQFLRTTCRHVLVAYLLYLLSIWHKTHPRSLSPMFGVAVRIAERMNIGFEAICADSPVLEGEMQRRLWWTLKQFDTRIRGLDDYRPTTLGDTWDCHTPLNINDTDLRPEMTQLPDHRSVSSEAVLVVVRSLLSDFTRSKSLSFDFSALQRKHIIGCSQPSSLSIELNVLSQRIETEFLQFCDPNNGLHAITISTARCQLASYRLILEHLKNSGTPREETDENRDKALLYAIDVLKHNTQMMTSPLTARYRWFITLYFPFAAYVHILSDLKQRSRCALAQQAWEAMKLDYDSRFSQISPGDERLFAITGKFIVDAWQAIEASIKQQGGEFPEPSIVTDIKLKKQQRAAASYFADNVTPNEVLGMSNSAYDVLIPTILPLTQDAVEGSSPNTSRLETLSEIGFQPDYLFDNHNVLDENTHNWTQYT